MKKQTIFSLTLVVVCLLIVLVANKFAGNVNKTLTPGAECNLQQNACQFVDDLGSISTVFKQPPIIEEELSVEIKLSNDLILNDAWVEGVNMYMGRIPVISDFDGNFDAGNRDLRAKDSFKGIFFLGSCTEPTMLWVMIIEVQNTVTDQTKSYKVYFTTNAN